MSRKNGATRRVKNLYRHVLAGEAGSYYLAPGTRGRGWSSHGWTSPQWQACLFAKDWHMKDEVDLRRLERIVFKGPDMSCVIRFAREVPGANVKRASRQVELRGSVEDMKKMAVVPGANRDRLERAAIIAEVMSA